VRLDLALIRVHPTLSRRRARAAIEKGQVTVEGTRVREAGHDVEEGAKVEWDPHRKALPRARCSLPILYEDEHLLVVDKPAGLLVVPSGPGRREEDTVLARVREYVARLRPRAPFAERVHRLDRDTTGALAFALSTRARAGLVQTFRTHSIERRYLAIVEGEPRSDRGIVDAPIRDAWISGRRGVARESEPGRAARTHWRVRERLAGATLLEVDLETGRQHQIRVHLAHSGLPVLGDGVYGVPGRDAPRRPMLHAWLLAFAHPVSGERVAVKSPVPADFTRVLRRLRKPGTSKRPDPRRPKGRAAPRRRG
jgi:23S rRNA pseudouridine1911/1915/1917 synthase